MTAAGTVAERLRPVVKALLGTDEPPVALRLWDGSTLGPPGTSDPRGGATVVVRSPDALRRILYAPNELGFGRAYVAGDIDVEGDIYAALDLRDAIASPDQHAELKLRPKGWVDAARVARQLGVLRRPLPPPPEEVRLKGRRHTKQRDAAAIAHHYDVGNDFYRLVLGPSMTYSCAYFTSEDATLEEAQAAKYDLVCRKLGLQPGMRLLDVGCGWGGMVIHAAKHHGVTAVGVTLSEQQADYAAKWVADEGLGDRVEVRFQDYRDIDDGPYDAISSIGMFEHVGLSRLAEYFGRLRHLLRPQGRLLNHGISRPPGAPPSDSKSFPERYVFPDGELHEVGSVVSAIQDQGLEVRDVHSLREHYARTLRQWVGNLESRWDDAVALSSPGRARVWRLYMAASAVNFEAGRAAIHQVLAVRTDARGGSGMPLTRSSYA